MPGFIEASDPGEPSGGFHPFVTYRTEEPAPLTKVDLEFQADRLRFMGLDEVLVAEFLRRASADQAAAHRWLGARTAEMVPPKPPTCDCGEVLAGLDWRGVAIMRCSECGARWRIEINDAKTWSQAAIDGASDAWLAAHPVEYDDPYGDFEPVQVIETGLPPLVDAIEPGTGYPVASWTGGGHAAVLYVCRQKPGEFDLPGDEYENEIEHLIREERLVEHRQRWRRLDQRP
ncbi:MAG: hypothetical protein ACRDZW_07220 [Acidimicrobiales bacterium]